jgi:hypothetical protein
VVYKNKYMPIYIAKIYSFNCGSSGLVVVRLIIDNTKYGGVLRGSEVGMS